MFLIIAFLQQQLKSNWHRRHLLYFKKCAVDESTNCSSQPTILKNYLSRNTGGDTPKIRLPSYLGTPWPNQVPQTSKRKGSKSGLQVREENGLTLLLEKMKSEVYLVLCPGPEDAALLYEVLLETMMWRAASSVGPAESRTMSRHDTVQWSHFQPGLQLWGPLRQGRVFSDHPHSQIHSHSFLTKAESASNQGRRKNENL